ANTIKTTPEAVLAERIEAAGRRVMRTDVNEAGLRPYDGKIPPRMYGAESGRDDGLSRLTPDRYVAIRIGDQITYYRNRTNGIEKVLRRWRWAIYIVGGIGTALAAINQQLWVAMMTALVTAFSAYVEFRQYDRTL